MTTIFSTLTTFLQLCRARHVFCHVWNNLSGRRRVPTIIRYCYCGSRRKFSSFLSLATSLCITNWLYSQSCTGFGACSEIHGDISINVDSCNGEMSCYSLSFLNPGDFFTVSNQTCIGDESCSGTEDQLTVGENRCVLLSHCCFSVFSHLIPNCKWKHPILYQTK